SFTSLFGLKPTRGRTPVGPGVGREWQGAAINFVLSRSVRDSAAMLDALQVVQPEAAFQTPLFLGRYVNRMYEELEPMHIRSEEHTSELQSRFDLVCRLLLEKKNTNSHERLVM